jgi:hypothetical protein
MVNLPSIWLHIRIEINLPIIERVPYGITAKRGFDGSLILAPPQAPGWLVKSSEALWNEVEGQNDRRTDRLPGTSMCLAGGAGRQTKKTF